MHTPGEFFVIFQPKYRTPSAFDLNEKGVFKTRPGLTRDWGFRILANETLETRMQFVQLVDHRQTDPKTGELYVCKAVNETIPLDGELNPDKDLLAHTVTGETLCEELLAEFHQWRDGFLPLDEKERIDPDKLKEKLAASLEEAKTVLCRNLVRKNDSWVRSAMPFLFQRFQRGIFRRVGDELLDEYARIGGEDDAKGLIRKSMLFYRVLENDSDAELIKPDGNCWKDEDEIWHTWVGYAGSEEEAKRVCRSLNTVLVPLVRELEEEIALYS